MIPGVVVISLKNHARLTKLEYGMREVITNLNASREEHLGFSRGAETRIPHA